MALLPVVAYRESNEKSDGDEPLDEVKKIFPSSYSEGDHKGNLHCLFCGWPVHYSAGYFKHNPYGNNTRPFCTTMLEYDKDGKLTRNSINNLRRNNRVVTINFAADNEDDRVIGERKEPERKEEPPKNFTSAQKLAQHLLHYMNTGVSIEGDEIRLVKDMLINVDNNDYDSIPSNVNYFWTGRVHNYNPTSGLTFINFKDAVEPNAISIPQRVAEYRNFSRRIEGRVVIGYGRRSSQIFIDNPKKLGLVPKKYEFLLGYRDSE